MFIELCELSTGSGAVTSTPKEVDGLLKIAHIPLDTFQMWMCVTPGGKCSTSWENAFDVHLHMCWPPLHIPPHPPSSQKSPKLRSENTSIFSSKIRQLGSEDGHLKFRRWCMKQSCLGLGSTWPDRMPASLGIYGGKRVMFGKGTRQNTEGRTVENGPTQCWPLYHSCCLSWVHHSCVLGCKVGESTA